MAERESCAPALVYDIISKGFHQVMLEKGEKTMKHIKTLNTRDYKKSTVNGGCGECQTSCQSACKTSCTVGNQSCENKNK